MFNLIHLSEVTTTMDVIKEYPVNTALVADRQTAGRGKYGRKWVSEGNENIYLTLSLDTSNPSPDYSHYTFLSAISMIETIRKLANKPINITTKWPNDVLLDRKKFCGILLERDLQKNFLAIGIGVNVDSYPEMPERMLFQPTSLWNEGITLKRFDIINEFLNIFDKYSNQLLNSGFSDIRRQWLNYAYNLGKTITVKTKNIDLEGIFENLDEDGTLLLKTNDCTRRVLSGDIF